MLKVSTALLLSAVCCSAGTITYNVNVTIGFGDFTGDIVTDGTIGLLNNANIVGWNLVLNDGTDPLFTLTNSNSTEDIAPADQTLSATATQLSFNFDGPADSFLVFVSDISDVKGSESGVCWSIAPEDCLIPGLTASGISLIVGGNIGNAQFTSGTVIGTSPGSSTPESSTLSLIGLGMTALVFLRRHISHSS
jgi:hypothetical protein